MTFLYAGQNQETFDFYTFDESDESESPITPPIYIAQSPIMKQVYRKIKQFSSSRDSVLILGDRGAGKSFSARQIFCENPENKIANFVSIDARLTDSFDLEKQLFDPEKGLLLSCGEGKNLYIKNVDSLSQTLQKKIYSSFFKQKQKSLPRLTVSADERIFDTSDGKKLFYQPLFNVLANKTLIVPPLSQRRSCIPDLIALFNKEIGSKWRPAKEALGVLSQRAYSENLHSLKAVCLKTALHVKTNAKITLKDLDLILKKVKPSSKTIQYEPDMTLDDLIDTYIQMSLDHFKSKHKSAEALGISVKTIYNKIKTGKIIF